MSKSRNAQSSFALVPLKTATPPTTAGAVKSKSGRRRAARARKAQQSGVALPAAMGRVNRTGTASMQSAGGVTTVRHREYISDVSGSIGFAASLYRINPGWEPTFPWLSAIANRFESYRFTSLRFLFETMKGSSTVGTVIMAVDYDALDDAPIEKTEILSFANATRAPVWGSCQLVCPTQDTNKFGPQRYTRNGNVANSDLKTYDLGNLFVATQSCVDTSLIGELYVEYTVQLFTPHMLTDMTESVMHFAISGAGETKSAPFKGATKAITGGLPVEIYNDYTLQFKRVGEYLLSGILTGTGMGQADPTCGGAVTATPLLSSVPNGAGTTSTFQTLLKVLNPGDLLTMDFGAIAATLTALDFKFTPYAVGI